MFKTTLGIMLAIILLGALPNLFGLAWVIFKDRGRGRIYWFFSWLFVSFGLFVLLWLGAGGQIPAEARTGAYRWIILAAAIILALGVWPAALHLIFGFWQKDDRPDDLTATSGEKPADFWIEKISQIVRDEQMDAEDIRDAVRAELEDYFKNGRR